MGFLKLVKTPIEGLEALDPNSFLHRRLRQLGPMGAMMGFIGYGVHKGREGQVWTVQLGEARYTGVRIDYTTLFYPGALETHVAQMAGWRDIPVSDDIEA